MTMKCELLGPALEAACACLRKGNLAQAELLCREYIDHVPDDPAAYELLGDIAAMVGANNFAVNYYSKTLKLAPGIAQAKHKRSKLLADPPARANGPGNRFLLIKAWGYGFWSDVDHVLGQLLLAEISGRIPVVCWGANSLFRSDDSQNAFDLYFEPLSEYSIDDLVHPCMTYFPGKWHQGNLLQEDVNKWSGVDARVSGLLSLNRPEDVVVSDFHSSVYSLLPWVPEGSPYFGMSPEAVYRALFTKYIRVRPHLQEKVERFWSEKMEGRRWLAVHVRGSDKELEVANLQELNDAYFQIIDDLLTRYRELSIFLLTDCCWTEAKYRKKYHSRLFCTESTRVEGSVGVHYTYPGQQVGEEVLVDVYLAGRCDLFLGNGRSNVSTAVQHLKQWQEGTYWLLGDNFLFRRNLFLHDW